MKIAYFISNRSTVPSDPKEITASTTVVLNIINQLKNKHDITLYAPKGSAIEGVRIVDLDLPPFKIDSSFGDGDWTTKAVIGLKQIFLGALMRDSYKYDLIHVHTEPVYLGFPYTELIKTPILFTTHNAYHEAERDIFCYYDGRVNLAALSKKQASQIPWKSPIPVVYNGIEFEKFPFSEKSEGYFLFVGRMVEEKGIDDFLELAESDPIHSYVILATGKHIFEEKAQKLSETKNNVVYKKIVPRLSPEWFSIFGNAKALIMPIKWDEPFGLTAIEAMACGTPVIAYNRGALPEIVIDNKTGIITKSNTIEGLKDAISILDNMASDVYISMRTAARKHIEDSFSTTVMANQYETLYKKITDSY